MDIKSMTAVPVQRQTCEINNSDECCRAPAPTEVYVIDLRNRNPRLRRGMYGCRACVNEREWTQFIRTEVV